MVLHLPSGCVAQQKSRGEYQCERAGSSQKGRMCQTCDFKYDSAQRLLVYLMYINSTEHTTCATVDPRITLFSPGVHLVLRKSLGTSLRKKKKKNKLETLSINACALLIINIRFLKSCKHQRSSHHLLVTTLIRKYKHI